MKLKNTKIITFLTSWNSPETEKLEKIAKYEA